MADDTADVCWVEDMEKKTSGLLGGMGVEYDSESESSLSESQGGQDGPKYGGDVSGRGKGASKVIPNLPESSDDENENEYREEEEQHGWEAENGSAGLPNVDSERAGTDEPSDSVYVDVQGSGARKDAPGGGGQDTKRRVLGILLITGVCLVVIALVTPIAVCFFRKCRDAGSSAKTAVSGGQEAESSSEEERSLEKLPSEELFETKGSSETATSLQYSVKAATKKELLEGSPLQIESLGQTTPAEEEESTESTAGEGEGTRQSQERNPTLLSSTSGQESTNQTPTEITAKQTKTTRMQWEGVPSTLVKCLLMGSEMSDEERVVVRRKMEGLRGTISATPEQGESKEKASERVVYASLSRLIMGRCSQERKPKFDAKGNVIEMPDYEKMLPVVIQFEKACTDISSGMGAYGVKQWDDEVIEDRTRSENLAREFLEFSTMPEMAFDSETSEQIDACIDDLRQNNWTWLRATYEPAEAHSRRNGILWEPQAEMLKKANLNIGHLVTKLNDEASKRKRMWQAGRMRKGLRVVARVLGRIKAWFAGDAPKKGHTYGELVAKTFAPVFQARCLYDAFAAKMAAEMKSGQDRGFGVEDCSPVVHQVFQLWHQCVLIRKWRQLRPIAEGRVEITEGDLTNASTQGEKNRLKAQLEDQHMDRVIELAEFMLIELAADLLGELRSCLEEVLDRQKRNTFGDADAIDPTAIVDGSPHLLNIWAELCAVFNDQTATSVVRRNLVSDLLDALPMGDTDSLTISRINLEEIQAFADVTSLVLDVIRKCDNDPSDALNLFCASGPLWSLINDLPLKEYGVEEGGEIIEARIEVGKWKEDEIESQLSASERQIWLNMEGNQRAQVMHLWEYLQLMQLRASLCAAEVFDPPSQLLSEFDLSPGDKQLIMSSILMAIDPPAPRRTIPESPEAARPDSNIDAFKALAERCYGQCRPLPADDASTGSICTEKGSDRECHRLVALIARLPNSYSRTPQDPLTYKHSCCQRVSGDNRYLVALDRMLALPRSKLKLVPWHSMTPLRHFLLPTCICASLDVRIKLVNYGLNLGIHPIDVARQLSAMMALIGVQTANYSNVLEGTHKKKGALIGMAERSIDVALDYFVAMILAKDQVGRWVEIVNELLRELSGNLDEWLPERPLEVDEYDGAIFDEMRHLLKNEIRKQGDRLENLGSTVDALFEKAAQALESHQTKEFGETQGSNTL